MPRVTLNRLGLGGIIRDLPPHALPPELWSDGKNVRFLDEKVIKFEGHQAVFDPPTIPPYWLMGVRTATNHLWMYAGLTEVYTVSGGVHSKITRASGTYSADPVRLWNGGSVSGIPVINNGVDVPQSWSPLSPSQLLVDLPNWPATDRCRIIRPYKSFLVALNVTQSSTVKPHMVKWSDVSDPGSVPGSWDEADATKSAGETELTDIQNGVIQDALALRDSLIIYKDEATHGMQFTGDQFVHRFYPIFVTSGILSTHCVSVLPDGSRHFVASGDDIIIHDGQQGESILNKRWQKWISNNIDSTNFNRSFTVSNQSTREAMLCFPEAGALWPTKALVWNMVDGAIGVRDLTEVSFMAEGIIEETLGAPDDWDSAGGSWDSDSDVWDLIAFRSHALDLMMADPVNTKLFHFDQGNQFDTKNFEAYVERTGLAIAGQDRQGNAVVDIGVRKLATRIWPRLQGGPVEIRIGAQEEIGGPVTWATPQLFDPLKMQYLDFCVSGRLLAIRIESFADVAWELQGYDIQVEVLGEI